MAQLSKLALVAFMLSLSACFPLTEHDGVQQSPPAGTAQPIDGEAPSAPAGQSSGQPPGGPSSGPSSGQANPAAPSGATSPADLAKATFASDSIKIQAALDSVRAQPGRVVLWGAPSAVAFAGPSRIAQKVRVSFRHGLGADGMPVAVDADRFERRAQGPAAVHTFSDVKKGFINFGCGSDLQNEAAGLPEIQPPMLKSSGATSTLYATVVLICGSPAALRDQNVSIDAERVILSNATLSFNASGKFLSRSSQLVLRGQNRITTKGPDFKVAVIETEAPKVWLAATTVVGDGTVEVESIGGDQTIPKVAATNVAASKAPAINGK